MTSGNYSEDFNLGRGWLNRAAEMLDSCEDHVSDAEFARAAAAIGAGFIALAHAERAAASAAEVSEVRQAILSLSDEPETTLGEAIAREKRAEDEARPHDNEPGSLADRLIAIANAVYGNDTRHVLDAPTGHGLAAVVRALADGPLIQTEWAAGQFTKLAFELETAEEATDRG